MAAEDFRPGRGGGGFLPSGNGGGAFAGVPDDDDGLCNDRTSGALLVLRRVLMAFDRALSGRDGPPADEGGGGAANDGGIGGLKDGDDSLSEPYAAELRSAPVSTPPPRLRNFGMPPTNKPPSWGTATSTGVDGATSRLLLLRPRFGKLGTAGARPPGTGGAPPGTGGAPPGPEPDTTPPLLLTWGADRSLVSTLRSRAPEEICPRRADWR